jgi:hypothetical protein
VLYQLLKGLANYFLLARPDLPLDYKKHLILFHVLGDVILLDEEEAVPASADGHYSHYN